MPFSITEQDLYDWRTKMFWQQMEKTDKDYIIHEIGVRGMNKLASQGGPFLNIAINRILYPDEMLDERFHYLIPLVKDSFPMQ
jgi:hypothetical protein